MSSFANSPSKGARGNSIAVKGIRNGLLFSIADDVSFADAFAELTEKLQGEKRPGEKDSPAVAVYLDFGDRELSEEDDSAVRELFAGNEDFTLESMEGAPQVRDLRHKDPYVLKSTVRSGQVIEHDGDIVVIGDVNPGAQLIATGDVYIMGYLRGSAHAGASGDHRAIVAATYFDPIQVRIAGVIRRAPERRVQAAEMEFAYLDGEHMAIEKMEALGQYRARGRTSRVVV
ncbi:MAG: septum site-determining protein MinC [Firmicutes bacterium]|nr:septum site-determining protein MinC [Bacillota bacterium]